MANYEQAVYNRSCNISKLAVVQVSSFIHTLYVSELKYLWKNEKHSKRTYFSR